MASQSTLSFKVHSVGAVRRSSFGKMTAWFLFFIALFNLFSGVAIADVEVDKRELGGKPASKSEAPVEGVKIKIRDFTNLSNATDSEVSNMPLAERNLNLILRSVRRFPPSSGFLKECKSMFSCIFNKDSIMVPQDVYDLLNKLGENFTGYFWESIVPKVIIKLSKVFALEIYGAKPTDGKERSQWNSKRRTVLTLLNAAVNKEDE
ncbi:putative integral membrane protein [Babesia bovis T2Bo]|uniref:Membrane protein, putative n=1 Tax=Babesia bovis TaxID=5865 RepID=A7ANJ4_BABBO|nr:putative integral membrane protein [Babesia bovis T2Bo]EDO08128.1 putative integral membrane protein [Babesia bovis T2Bo]|eukprot:XP_001611696.1 membrane protein [Babesia bovis T2Bo]